MWDIDSSMEYLLDLLDLLEWPAECEGPLSEVWEEEVKTSCSSPHPLFTMFDPGVSAGAVDVEPVPVVDVEDLFEVDALSWGDRDREGHPLSIVTPWSTRISQNLLFRNSH